jgi:NAD(P)-dependent dehydrogenase (short-subunit alcohol dehydrogenase family)
MKTPKTALITGANRGIGFEVARQLAEKAFHVFLAARHREAGEKAVAALQKDGVKVCFVALDVGDPNSIKRATQEVGVTVDHLDVLVNNAAILEDEHLSVQIDEDQRIQTSYRWVFIQPLVIKTFGIFTNRMV